MSLQVYKIISSSAIKTNIKIFVKVKNLITKKFNEKLPNFS